MPAALDLKHVGLIVSAGAAVALRFLSDFSFAAIQHQATLARLDLSRLAPAALAALWLNTLSYELQRDWFNLSPQAVPELAAVLVSLVLAYGLLRRRLAPERAAAAMLLIVPFVPLVVTVGGCAWVLAQPARST